MIGEKNKEEKLFYYLRPEDLIPEDHILRLIDKHVDFAFIRSKVQHLYSHTGRPSVDPEVMMRMLLVGYLFGITSERRLCDEVQMHLGYRWFVGLSLQDKVPDHSTFSKNRHGRFKESGIYQEMFDAMVRQGVEQGLVNGQHLTVDSTLVKANASFRTMEPIVVKLKPKEYMCARGFVRQGVWLEYVNGERSRHRRKRISNLRFHISKFRQQTPGEM